MMEKRPVLITETILRDAHQSLMATRMKTSDMLEVAEQLDEVGYHSLEAWGGATFDTALRYLHECPWERLSTLKFRIRNTPLQMLLRGQNLLGYRHYPDDVVEAFTMTAVQTGISIVRIFDALNDVRNMLVAITATKKAGGHAQGAIVYTISPVHDEEHYVGIARQLKEAGVDSLCIKDMAGLLAPYDAYKLIKRLKQEVGLPISLHTHYTSGMGSMTYLKGIEAGTDVVDTALSTFALGSSQPPTESIVAALKGTQFDTGLDLKKLSAINGYFAQKKKEYGEVVAPISVNTEILSFQVPGGMLSNLRSQLMQQGLGHKLQEVYEEVPRVRADMGYPPLVTPMSQIVGTQAVINVAVGERYKVKSKEIRDYVKGLYGKPPAPISEEIRKMIIGDDEVIDCRPADLLEPQLEKARQEIKEYARNEKDVLSYIAFPNVALEYFKYRETRGY
jgi:oxaloacetate decarboxylase alpha subunit